MRTFFFKKLPLLGITICAIIVFFASPSANAAVCGDSEPDMGEQCDDGNLVNGDGCSATCTIEAGWDCSVPIAGQSIENLLINGDFDDGVAPWSNSGTPFNPICTQETCGADFSVEQGGGFFWSGGAPSMSTTTASQSLVIPATATSLEFSVWKGFCVPEGGTADTVSVIIDGNEVFNSGVCTSAPGYETFLVDIESAIGGPYNDGGTHTLTIAGSMDFMVGDSQTGSIFVDNIAVNQPLIPLVPPTPSACLEIVCGDSILGSTEQCDDGNTTAGDGCSAICEIEQPNFVCQDPIPSSSSGENVLDGSFEAGPTDSAWSQTGTVSAPICSQALCGLDVANQGAFYALFGGSSLANDQTLSQNITIASTATNLTFELQLAACDSSDDKLTVEIDGTSVFSQACTAATQAYQTQTIALTAFADGGTHNLQFIGHTQASNGGNSDFLVDDISIQDNTFFPGIPGSCGELKPACSTVEQFEAGIPGNWTIVNLGDDPSDGWGSSADGICASQGGLSNPPANNFTKGGGLAACADSNATGQIDINGGGATFEMNTYLCSPALDLSQVTNPSFDFLVNYQAENNSLNDNGSPGNSTDDFDDDFLQVLVGTVAPNALTLPNAYTTVDNIIDHTTNSIMLSSAQAKSVDLSAFNSQASAWVCFQYRGNYAWMAQVDNAGLRGSVCSAPVLDSDNDGVNDDADNCTLHFNPAQEDTNGDGFGNRCDPDLDNNGVVNFVDFGQLRAVFLTTDPDADFNSDGTVNFIDVAIFRDFFLTPPGPSALVP
jgi:cysteine-rich repeat protein